MDRRTVKCICADAGSTECNGTDEVCKPQKKTCKCPVCKKKYVRMGWLQKHIENYGAPGYKAYSDGVHRQKSLVEFV